MNNLKLILLIFCIGAISSPGWSQSYTLDEAIAYTLEHSYDIRRSDLEIEKAQKQIWEATATGLPQVSLSGDYNYNIDIPVAFISGQEIELGTPQTLSGTVSASQLLFSGAYLVGLRSAKAVKLISELSKEKAQSQLTEAVINAYAAVVISDENIKIIEKNVAAAAKNFSDIQQIYKAGFTEEQNVDQIQYSLTQLQYSESFAKGQKEKALNTLKFVMGLKQEDTIATTTTMENLMEDNLALETATTLNPENHIDFRIADHQTEINALQVKYQKTLGWPTLSTSFTHTQNNFSSTRTVFQDFGTWAPSTVWALSLNFPVFTSFAKRSRVQQAQIDLEESEIERERVEEELKQNVRNAKIDYDKAIENYNTAKDLVSLSQKIYDKEKIKYFEGLSSSTELNTIEQQLYQSENQFIQSCLSVIQAKTTLEQTLGKY